MSEARSRRDFLMLAGGATAVAAGAAVLGVAGRADASPSEDFPAGLTAVGETEKAFTSIDGVPIYYDRNGSLQRLTFYCTNGFYSRLVTWKRRLVTISAGAGSAYSSLSYFASAGTYVSKPGAHGLGRAIDIDQVVWSGAASRPIDREYASGTLSVRRRYLALDAVTRGTFRYVLDGWYDAGHQDHIHADDTALPTICSTGSRSDTVFVQATCNAFTGTALTVDGVWGSRTGDAFKAASARLGVTGDPHTSSAAWLAWTERAAARGFANLAF
ncbi:MAG: hypothetical protein AVDCRST_MAG41-3401 [uncultured Corynebacteriales bacterium]|uniref:Extensin-like C-terminal domain-containing protein n=1 Tax=uncultured Mycobacteriales bacterium TaxID=581187 RepID=A0A6J4JGZ5_9ACTN|nr:MAG: hypothetical protein AVDCRST_MAG41-3401 [uncultured Corynebacteriales bacterium]